MRVAGCGIRVTRFGGRVHRREQAARQDQLGLHLLGRFQVVVDVGREDHFVAFDEEPRGLEANDQVLGRRGLGSRVADLRGLGERVPANPPGGQGLRERDLRLRLAVRAEFQGRKPQCCIGEVGPHFGFDQTACPAGLTLGLRFFQGPRSVHGGGKVPTGYQAGHRFGSRLVCGHWPSDAGTRHAGNPLKTVAAHAERVQSGPTHPATAEPAAQAQAVGVQAPPALPAIRHAAEVDRLFGPSERAHRTELVLDGRVDVRRVMPLLAPEEHARARTELILDVRDRLVVRGQRDLARDGLAGRVRSAHPHGAFLAGFVLRFVGFDLDRQQPLDGRDEQFLSLRVDSPIADQRGLDVEVRHVSSLDRQVDHRGTGRDVNETVVQQRTAADVIAEQNSRVALRHVDQQVGRLAYLVRPLVGDDLQVVETVDPPVELRAGGPEDRVAEHFLAPRVLGLEGDAELPLAGNRITQLQPPVRVRLGLPAFDNLFTDIAVIRPAVADAIDDHLATGRNRHVVGRQRADVHVRLVLRPVPAAVGLDKREELLPRDDHAALSLDRPPALVADLDLNSVPMVAVGLLLQGPRRVDFQFVGPVRL